jgi:hypothetical protein
MYETLYLISRYFSFIIYVAVSLHEMKPFGHLQFDDATLTTGIDERKCHGTQQTIS